VKVKFFINLISRSLILSVQRDARDIANDGKFNVAFCGHMQKVGKSSFLRINSRQTSQKCGFGWRAALSEALSGVLFQLMAFIVDAMKSCPDPEICPGAVRLFSGRHRKTGQSLSAGRSMFTNDSCPP
jgi:hypothetical protein